MAIEKLIINATRDGFAAYSPKFSDGVNVLLVPDVEQTLAIPVDVRYALIGGEDPAAVHASVGAVPLTRLPGATLSTPDPGMRSVLGETTLRLICGAANLVTVTWYY